MELQSTGVCGRGPARMRSRVHVVIKHVPLRGVELAVKSATSEVAAASTCHHLNSGRLAESGTRL